MVSSRADKSRDGNHVGLDKVLVIIPALNEEANVGNTIDEVHQMCPQVDILVVDDDSSDSTAQISRGHGAAVVTLPSQLGYSNAIQTGLRYALQEGYCYAVTLDADGQHNPRFILPMLSHLRRSNASIVIGSRWQGRDSCNLSFIRKLGMWSLSKIVHWATGQELTDTSSGFQAYSRPGMAALVRSNLPTDHPDADVVVSLARTGIVFTEVPVNMRPRIHGRGMNDGTIGMLRYAYHMLVGLLAHFVDPTRKDDPCRR